MSISFALYVKDNIAACIFVRHWIIRGLSHRLSCFVLIIFIDIRALATFVILVISFKITQIAWIFTTIVVFILALLTQRKYWTLIWQTWSLRLVSVKSCHVWMLLITQPCFFCCCYEVNQFPSLLYQRCIADVTTLLRLQRLVRSARTFIYICTLWDLAQRSMLWLSSILDNLFLEYRDFHWCWWSRLFSVGVHKHIEGFCCPLLHFYLNY